MAWGKIYGARQPLGMQRRDRGDCFHIIVPSSSSQRYAFVCRVFFFFLLPFYPCAPLCVSLCDCVGLGVPEKGEYRGRGEMEYIELMSANLCLKGGRRAMAETSVKVEHGAYDRTFVFVCVSVCLATCSPH